MRALYPFLLVFIGGGLGSICRFGLSLLIPPTRVYFPWATLAANGLACLVLGFLLGTQLKGDLHDRERWLWATGFCGGFSTFSTFTADSWLQFQNGAPLAAWVNILGNLLVCWGCLLVGLRMA